MNRRQIADVWPADQGDADDVVRCGGGGWRNEFGDVVEQFRDADVVFGGGFDDGFDAETLEWAHPSNLTQSR